MNSKMEYFSVLLVLLTFCAANVHSLDCFVCDGEGCNDIQDSMVQTCQSEPTQPPSTSENPSTGDDSTIDTTVETGPTTNVPEGTTNTNEETTENPPPEVLSFRRSRSVANEHFIKPADLLIQNYRLAAGSVRAEPMKACFSVDTPDSKRKHGCIEFNETNGACNAVRDKYRPGATVEEINCYSCGTDKCNGSATFGFSIILLVASVLLHKLH